MYDKKSDILKWIGDHFTDGYTPQSATFSIIADLLKSIEVYPKKSPTYSQVNTLRCDLQRVMKENIDEWDNEAI